MTESTKPTEPAPLDLDAIERIYIALKYSPWMGTADVLPLVSEARRLRRALAELQYSNTALLAACTEETNRADKAEAEVSRLLQLLTPSMANVTIGEICGQKQER